MGASAAHRPVVDRMAQLMVTVPAGRARRGPQRPRRLRFVHRQILPAQRRSAYHTEDVFRFERAAFAAGIPMPEPTSAGHDTLVHRAARAWHEQTGGDTNRLAIPVQLLVDPTTAAAAPGDPYGGRGELRASVGTARVCPPHWCPETPFPTSRVSTFSRVAR
jgi:hypothetical protein